MAEPGFKPRCVWPRIHALNDHSMQSPLNGSVSPSAMLPLRSQGEGCGTLMLAQVGKIDKGREQGNQTLLSVIN